MKTLKLKRFNQPQFLRRLVLPFHRCNAAPFRTRGCWSALYSRYNSPVRSNRSPSKFACRTSSSLAAAAMRAPSKTGCPGAVSAAGQTVFSFQCTVFRRGSHEDRRTHKLAASERGVYAASTSDHRESSKTPLRDQPMFVEAA